FIKADKLGLADRLKTPPSPLLPSCTAKPESLPGNNNNTPTKLNLCSLLLLAGWLVLLGLGEFAPFLSLLLSFLCFWKRKARLLVLGLNPACVVRGNKGRE
ncbi:unnamed protein product, partial [Linum tenue]